MTMNMRPLFAAPSDWPAVSVPDWFKERANAVIAELGEESEDVQLFKEILADGHISQNALEKADKLASTTKNQECFLLAIEIGSHAYTVVQSIGQLMPIQAPRA